jgi:hypothetical protein
MTTMLRKAGIYWPIVFISLAFVHIVLMFLSARSVWHDISMPWLLRTGVMATEIIYLAIGITLLAVVQALLFHSQSTRKQRTTGRRVLGFLFALALLLAYFSSWGTFEIIGVFSDFDAIRMFLHDPAQLLQHATHIATSLVLKLVLLALILAWFFSITLVWMKEKIPERVHPQVQGFAAALVIIAVTATLLSAVRAGNSKSLKPALNSGVEFTIAEIYQQARKRSAGPIAALSPTVLVALARQSSEQVLIHGYSAKWKPQISMQDYLERVDTNLLSRKNVIVILIESLRADQLEAYGGEGWCDASCK